MTGKVTIKNAPDYQIFKFYGDLDNMCVYQNKEKICLEINKRKCKTIFFDLNMCDFIDSSGIGLILGRYNQLNQYGTNLIVCGVNSKIKKLIQISGIAKIIDIYEDVSENIIKGEVCL